MIWNLNQVNFREFGTILPDKESLSVQMNHHSIPLASENTYIYQTMADTWLSGESG